jgi:hypothetical protein
MVGAIVQLDMVLEEELAPTARDGLGCDRFVVLALVFSYGAKQ